jgi:hypothetical protein
LEIEGKNRKQGYGKRGYKIFKCTSLYYYGFYEKPIIEEAVD